MLHSLAKRRIALACMIAIGGAVAISSVGIVRADQAAGKAHPAKLKSCNSSSYCQGYQNNGSGPAFSATATAANTRAVYVVATNSGADGVDIDGGYIGIIGRAPAGSGTFPLVLTDGSGNNLDYTNGDGDIYYAGTLNQFLRTRNNQRVVAYTSQTTTRTLEDVGSARLVNGQSTVVLDRTYATSIDMSAPYHVFLTPNGDTRGLYVAAKTPGSFTVRETQGGHGTLSFDYRIVASPAGQSTERVGAAVKDPSATLYR